MLLLYWRPNHVLQRSVHVHVMFEAVNIVNQRPIWIHSTDLEDGSFVCPNDLILGRASPNFAQGHFLEQDSHKFRFDYIQQVVEIFWKKWIREYLPGIIVSQKWHVDKKNINCLIQDSKMVKGEWRLGVVTKTHPNDENKIRRVIV